MKTFFPAKVIDLNFFIKIIFLKNSLNLSGPACGLVECPSAYPVGDDEESFTLSEHRDELCETLCGNGLGVC